MDGIILTPDTYEVDGLEDRIRGNIKEKGNCPVVSVRGKIDEYQNVLIDDNTVIEELIEHFITKHGFTRLNFLAGPKGFPDSEKRLESYKKVLRENNITIEEERIYYGDFWMVKAYEAVDYWMDSSLEMPQAIICANDYMAIAVCNALKAKGLSVPDDIAVSGCDDVEGASINSPTITTARVPVEKMGIEAVDKIHNISNGLEEKDTYLKTTPKYRQSCGCAKGLEGQQEIADARRNYLQRQESLVREIAGNAYMSADLTGKITIDTLVDKLFYLVYANVGFSKFCLCLKENWEDYKEESTGGRSQITDKMEMVMGQNRKEGFTKISFNRRELVPKELVDDEPMVLYFTVIHHHGDYFGYAAIGFEENKTYMTSYRSWIINICNALENVRLHGKMERLVLKLEDMSVRDELTGLFNRRAIETLGQQYIHQAYENNVQVMILSADMDKLKDINDNYGHASGDIALKIVADALRYASDDDEIYLRMGGDEFAVIGLDYDEEKAERYLKRVKEKLDEFNRIEKHDFKVKVSYGYTLIYPNQDTTVESCLALSDAKMYMQKQENRRRSINK